MDLSGASEVSLKAWRIENFEKVPVSDDDIGEFFDGDSYIVLYTYTVPPSTAEQYIIYFWQGRYSSQDEEGASAILTVEMDEAMGGAPVQVRVEQGKESRHFRALFKSPMIIHSGGVASGFRSVKASSGEGEQEENSDGILLYRVKGNNDGDTYAFAVEESASSLNSTTSYVLMTKTEDGEKKGAVWKGSHTSDHEYSTALAVAKKLSTLDDEVVTIDETEEPESFWEALGGKTEYLQFREDEPLPSDEPLLCKMTDAFGQGDSAGESLEIIPVASPFTQEDLSTNDVMCLDIGTALFVWIGEGANENERTKAFIMAKKYVAKKEMKPTPTLIKVLQGKEPIMFTHFFDDWDPELFNKNKFVDPREGKLEEELEEQKAEMAVEGDVTVDKVQGFWLKKDKKAKSDGTFTMTGWNQPSFLPDPSKSPKLVKQESINFEVLHARRNIRDQTIQDGGEGEIKMWRIENFEKVEIAEENIGEFYDGDSFIVLYTYKRNGTGRTEQIIYFWQGRYSSSDEEGASALLAKQLDESLSGTQVQVRVVQGKEPPHFRSLFKGTMVIHGGGVTSGFRSLKSSPEGNRNDATDGFRLYCVNGSSPDNTRAFAVEESASSLNSCSCYLSVNDNTSQFILWKGRHCNDYEHAAAAKLAAKLTGSSNKVDEVEEGSEPESFWTDLGGKQPYADIAVDEELPSEPRLFHCEADTGTFSVTEIDPFAQTDLDEGDVFLLDVGTSLFVWIGSNANEREKTESFKTAHRYLDTKPTESEDSPDATPPIITVQSGSEPLIFTQWFEDWDPNLRENTETFVDPYQLKLDKLKEEEEAAETPAPVPAPQAVETDVDTDGVDPAHREDALTDEEFASTFEMTRDEFSKLPQWRQVMKKKEVGLF